MCGISGFVLANNQRPDKELLVKMNDSLKSRGPDSSGIWIQDNFAFGHRRLKIIDLSDEANQPMLNKSGDISLVFNGEIYNFQELREELKKNGCLFKTNSDTEVLLQAYEKWGIESFKKFNGMFAFAIADLRTPVPLLFLVRDRWGIKPLYYNWKDGCLSFASTPGALLKLPWISKQLDKKSIAHYLRFAHFPQEMSVYSEIKQVLPGQYFELREQNLQSHKYFHATQIINESNKSDPKDLDKILERSIARQLVSDTEVGCFLSGGIDSSLLVSYASNMTTNLKTFSIGYSEHEFDETPFAQEVSKYFGTTHQSFILKPEDLKKRARDLPGQFDQPLGDPTILPTLYLSEYVSKEVKVVLSGDGGDELFAGYPHQKALIKLEAFSKLPLVFRKSLTPSVLGKVGTLMSFENKAEWIENFIGILGPLKAEDMANLLLDKTSKKSIVEKLLEEPEMNNLNWRQTVEQIYLRTFLPDTVLAKSDRAGMAYGLEARVPFLDDEVTNFAGSLDFSHKINGLTSKHILRELLKSKMPGKIHSRPKQGFSIPLRDWYRGDWKNWLEEVLSKENLQKDGVFNPEVVAQIMREHQSKKINHSHLLWCLMSFQLWYEQNK